MGILVSVHIGPIAPLGPGCVRSAFVKHAAAGRIAVEPLGLVGDHQADPRVHGGAEKAVYGYGADSYAAWRAGFPEHAALLVLGGVGENFSIAGLDEAAVCIGDIQRIGSAVLQACQPRQPCFKFALRFDDKRMPRAMVRTGRCGWYYRVLEAGEVGAGDAVTLVERPNPDWPMARFFRLLAKPAAITADEQHALAAMSGLAAQWVEAARAALG